MAEAVVTCVIDRFEGDLAVLILEPSGRALNWPGDRLPAGAARGDVLRVAVAVDREETQRRRKAVEERIARLRTGRTH